MRDDEWFLPRPVRWLLDRCWRWLAEKVLPEGDAALFEFDDEEEIAA